MTIADVLFACCLVFFGPAFGFWAAYRNLGSRAGKVAAYFIATFAAYAGWFVSGMTSMFLYPNHPVSGNPGEFIACLYAVPGFITGYIGVMLLDKMNRAEGRQ